MASKIKFQCHIIQKNPGDFDVLLKPAEGDHAEHAGTFNAGATGLMRLDGMSADFASQFEPGKFYYLDFTPLN